MPFELLDNLFSFSLNHQPYELSEFVLVFDRVSSMASGKLQASGSPLMVNYTSTAGFWDSSQKCPLICQASQWTILVMHDSHVSHEVGAMV